VRDRARPDAVKDRSSQGRLGSRDPVRAVPRVVMVVRLFDPWVGGMERQAARLAGRLVVDGLATVRIVTGWWFRGTPRHDVVGGIRVFRNHTLWNMGDVRGLRKFAGYLYMLTLVLHLWRTRNDYDVIHVHGLSYHTYASVVAGRLVGKPVIAKLANSGSASDIEKMRTEKHLPLSRFMLGRALTCTRLVALSEAVEAELIEAGASPDRIVRIPNGIDVPEGSVSSEATPSERHRLIAVGRLHHQKGFDVLMEALAELTERRPDRDFLLDVLGDGPLRDQLEEQVGRLGISDLVSFHGSVDDVLDRLGNAEVFVLPSRAEGLSNALLEAMSSGLVPVASDIPGNRAVIEDGFTGFLFPEGDSHALARVLDDLLDDRSLREVVGAAAADLVVRRFALEEVARRYSDLYLDVLGIAPTTLPVDHRRNHMTQEGIT
jgi:glycosyltransferase involved in cell wall biosynthesis